MKRQYSLRLSKIEEIIHAALPDSIDAAWLSNILADGPGSRPSAESRPALSAYEAILRPARELIERGGKRWRPMVMLLCCEMIGESQRALPLSALVELAHNGTLIIDDIEDRAEQRRGGPSVHVMYGEDMAINSGNLLYFLPTYLIDRSPFTPAERATFYRYYAEDMRRLHFGQGLDIQWHRSHDYWPVREEYLQMCRLKTGSLARLSARLGAAAAGADDAGAARVGDACEQMGIAFQIIDDVMNLTTGNPGKHRGDDIVEGKKSLPVVLQIERNPESADRLRRCFEAAEAEGMQSDAVEEAIQLLEQSGSIAAARRIADDLLARSAAEIDASYAPSEARELLVGIFEEFLAR